MLSRRAVLVLLFAIGACGAPAKPPIEMPPPEPPAAVTVPPADAAPPVQQAAAPAATSAISGSTPTSGFTPRVVDPPPPSCTGTSLDLDAILAAKACRTKANAEPPPATLAVRTDPAELRVAPGEHVDFALVFTNRGSESIDVDLEIGCGRFSLEAYDRAGKRADYINTTCGFGTGCGRGAVRLTLPPGGTITKVLGFNANVVKPDAACHDTLSGSMKAGTYELRIGTPLVVPKKAFEFRVVKTPLVVAP
jgi:hypothetical protein